MSIEFTHHGETYQRVDLTEALGEPGRFPYVLRILAENISRVSAEPRDSLNDLHDWLGHGSSTREIDFFPNRLLMHDTTSTPALVDLAAMRDALAEAGGDPTLLEPALPVDVSIDHSLAVEAFARPDAAQRNLQIEMQRNRERYAFLKWAARAMGRVRLNPPGTGIMHTINLEQLATVVSVLPTAVPGQADWIAPDVMLGTDSHTPMINGIGVLGWGIGGLEAEMVLLGMPCVIRIPEVVGVRLTGCLDDAATATDLALHVTHLLRQMGVTGQMVEFFGPGVSTLTAGQRSVVANMAPEYGATTGYFPVDEQVIEYLRLVAADRVDPSLVEAYCRATGLWFEPDVEPSYTRVVDLDLGEIRCSVAGPQRPQDLLALGQASAAVVASRADRAGTRELPPQPVAVAAITSCTNTSDPHQLLAAGLLARRARERGLSVEPWVKTSLAPGSPAARAYLERSGLMPDLAALGFDIVGFGCTTCIGNSGGLTPAVEEARQAGLAEPIAVLSGNRNFPGRVNPVVQSSLIMSPPLVVAYALAGDASVDLTTDPVGIDPDGQPVHLRDLWPSPREVRDIAAHALRAEDFPAAFEQARQSRSWLELPSQTTPTFAWNPRSTILRRPPFASLQPSFLGHYTASPLLVLGDDITTDHISPASAIPADSPVADFLVEQGEDRDDLNVFASRRGNWEVMGRGAFYAKAVRNALVPGGRVGCTRMDDGRILPLWEAAERYRAQQRPVVVVAGERYGMGSSRDWAAKAQWLLGVRAVLALSFERIHRSNLIGMGILPLLLTAEQRALIGEIDSSDQFDIDASADMLQPRGTVTVRVRRTNGDDTVLELRAAVETSAEMELLRSGGAIPSILRRFIPA